jgi:hypothetical protein
MPLDNELYLGTQAGGVNGMVKVSSLGQGNYASAIAEGSFTVDPVTFSKITRRADGGIIEQGWKQTAWHINGLRDSQYTALIAYKTALTTVLYIRTLGEDGKTYKDYLATALFQPVVNRGDPTAVESGAVFDFEIRFIKMIEQV